jgi:Fungal pheromone mating factor STE2 GPCR
VQIAYIIYVQNRIGTPPWWYFPLEKAYSIIWATTIGCASLVFVAKLLYLIHRRKKMGFKGFGPLQVITVMGAQCLVVPCKNSFAKYD